jgi:hypothetical protein
MSIRLRLSQPEYPIAKISLIGLGLIPNPTWQVIALWYFYLEGGRERGDIFNILLSWDGIKLSCFPNPSATGRKTFLFEQNTNTKKLKKKRRKL